MSRENKRITKICPVCEETFQCNAADIASCDCRKIDLKSEIRMLLSSRYDDCICPKCLQHLSEISERTGRKDG